MDGSGDGAVVVGVVLLVVVVWSLGTVKVVKPRQTWVIERQGKYHRTLTPGFNMMIPFLDKVRAKFDHHEQTKTFVTLIVSKDDHAFEVEATIWYMIVNPVLASYELVDVVQGMEQSAVTLLRTIIGSMEYGELDERYYGLVEQVRATLAETAVSWGVSVTNLQLRKLDTQPTPPAPWT